ncbi:beta-N-acetylhexosaminidase [Martelella endophytica]|uniref:beta-N-acetylhexosaminidase n=1 Tax=Martelella endophytica TaxID=1486262 RepID=A0A0D5LQA8_MAREN|nr:family 20 glycosylhydrolase [Martelella endophytica]AJY46331.1 beta-N-acetylhexosaminidase [Martelella endophytica]
MTKSAFRLENSWRPVDGDPTGAFDFSLHNLSDEPLSGFSLAYTSLTRVSTKSTFENAVFVHRNANYHEFRAPDGLTLSPGESWRFSVNGLTRPAQHRTDGAKSAYLILDGDRYVDIAVDDLMLAGSTAERPQPLLPEGEAKEPWFILPWPAALSLEPAEMPPVALYPVAGTEIAAVKSVDTVIALFSRLFESGHVPFSLAPVQGGKALAFEADDSLGKEAYAITFGETVTIRAATATGRQYALTVLAQMLSAARSKGSAFRFPASGTIEDQPRYGWRGTHLDVSRQFYETTDVLRLLDILAWHRMNIFHWHLTDDEAWRLEIKAYPSLTEIGATRAPGTQMPPQLGNGAKPVRGFYTQDDVLAVVARGASLGIEIIPEVDIPGHSTAALAALPELADGQEAPESYHSVQGFPNNALNPAIEETYAFLGKVFDEMVALFPARYIHIGGDEVANNTWLASPLAKALMEKEDIEGTFGLQSYFMKRIQKMLAERGKTLAGWDEVSHGGGVERDGTLLMAWQKPEVGIALAKDGYDVVMTPGQAYYLDMVQDEAFQEPGASWAGTVPPKHSYHYEAEGEFPEELKPKMRGVQSCIWSEHFLSRGYFNHLVFPRISAVAEAGWTPKARKDWLRFAALAPASPKL